MKKPKFKYKKGGKLRIKYIILAINIISFNLNYNVTLSHLNTLDTHITKLLWEFKKKYTFNEINHKNTTHLDKILIKM